MNASPDHEDPIEEAAADWLAQREAGFSTAQKRGYERWCRADPRHAAAVARLEAACALLAKMPLVRAELQPVVEFPVKPRTVAPVRTFPVLRVAFAAAAMLVVAAFGWRQWARPQPAQIHATSAGGYERVVLTDGSVLELNASSEVRVDLLPRERRVALRRGEAHFTVAPDPSRPFIVSAHGVAVRAVGTAFNVRLAAAAVEVLVTEGKVTVSEGERVEPTAPAIGTDPQPTHQGPRVPPADTLLAANQRAVIAFAAPKYAAPIPPPPGPVVEKITPEALREALAWQERRLAFSETPLRDVVAQFNRRNRTQLILGDASLAERPVGGTFAADNVEGFIRLLESSGAIAVERRDEATVVLRAAP